MATIETTKPERARSKVDNLLLRVIRLELAQSAAANELAALRELVVELQAERERRRMR
jgi:hypothetical protein